MGNSPFAFSYSITDSSLAEINELTNNIQMFFNSKLRTKPKSSPSRPEQLLLFFLFFFFFSFLKIKKENKTNSSPVIQEDSKKFNEKRKKLQFNSTFKTPPSTSPRDLNQQTNRS